MIFAIKNKRIVLVVLGLITLFFGYQLKNIGFEHNIESFFNKNDTHYAFSQDFFKQFKVDQKEKKKEETKLLVGIKSPEKITHSFMCKIDSLTSIIKELDEVRTVYSITNQKLFVFTSFGRYPYSLFHLDEGIDKFNGDKKALENYPDLKNRFISKDEKSILFYVILKGKLPVESVLSFREKAKKITNPFVFKDVHFLNSDLTNYLIVDKLQKESALLTGISLLLIIFILFLFFKSIKGVVIPLSVVLVCIVWIMGLIAFLGIPFNVLTISIPVIVGVISLSDVIHIISRFSEETETNRLKKLELTKKDIVKAIILTSVTTSFGFLSLIPSQIKVFVEFGFFTSVGVVFAFLLAYFLLPILIFNSNFKLGAVFAKITPKKIYQKSTILVSVVVITLCVLGISKVKNDNYIYDDVNAKDEASKAINMMANDFYGIRDLSLAITLNDTSKSLLDFEVIKKLNELEVFVDSVYHLNNNSSLVTIIKQMNRAMNGGLKKHFVLPDNLKSYNKLIKLMDKNHFIFNKNQFLSKNKKATFMYAKTVDLGSWQTNEFNKSLALFVDNNLEGILNVRPTGGSHIQDQTNFSVTKTMLFSLLVIVLFIVLIISYLFKSLRIGIVSLFPNMLPLFVITAIIGWFDMGMSISTSIVFTIVFGIAVDDTIHFLSRYKIEKDRGLSSREAVEETIKTSGGAISLTTIILITGFGVLMFSDFNANFYTGMFVCIGLLVALISDLFLLPVMLKLFDKEK